MKKRMYSNSIKNKAYALYLQGSNAEQISKALEDYTDKKIAPNTIRGWIEKEDSNGETWDDQKTKIEYQVRQRIENEATTEKQQVRTRVSTLSKALFDNLVNEKAPEVKSFEGAIYAFKALSEMSINLEDEDNERWSPVNAAHIILEELNNIPEVRKMLKKHWKKIQVGIAQKLNVATKTKEVTGETL